MKSTNLCRNTELFINHGGIHSVYESIWYKVPQICTPNQTEQEVNAKIVQKKKCGIYVKRLNERRLEKAIDMVLGGKAKFNIAKLSDEMQKGAPMVDAIK